MVGERVDDPDYMITVMVMVVAIFLEVSLGSSFRTGSFYSSGVFFISFLGDVVEEEMKRERGV